MKAKMGILTVLVLALVLSLEGNAKSEGFAEFMDKLKRKHGIQSDAQFETMLADRICFGAAMDIEVAFPFADRSQKLKFLERLNARVKQTPAAFENVSGKGEQEKVIQVIVQEIRRGDPKPYRGCRSRAKEIVHCANRATRSATPDERCLKLMVSSLGGF